MANKSYKEIQLALIAEGHDVGPDGADGDWGRNSQKACREFQRKKGLEQIDGIPGPRTLKALFPGEDPVTAPPWFANLLAKRTLHEKIDNAELRAYLKSDGQTLGDPAKLPWCGDAVQTPIAITLPNEPVPTNPYWAQNWSKFGVPLDVPTTGAILAFIRDGGGHVGFYVGEDDTRYYVLGGNQSNSISVAPVAKSQCIGIRWPKTYPLPTTGRVRVTSAEQALSSASMG